MPFKPNGNLKKVVSALCDDELMTVLRKLPMGLGRFADAFRGGVDGETVRQEQNIATTAPKREPEKPHVIEPLVDNIIRPINDSSSYEGPIIQHGIVKNKEERIEKVKEPKKIAASSGFRRK